MGAPSVAFTVEVLQPQGPNLSSVSPWETLKESGSVVLGADDHQRVGRLALEHCSSVVAARICCPERISADVLWSLGLYPHSAKKASLVDGPGLG